MFLFGLITFDVRASDCAEADESELSTRVVVVTPPHDTAVSQLASSFLDLQASGDDQVFNLISTQNFTTDEDARVSAQAVYRALQEQKSEFLSILVDGQGMKIAFDEATKSGTVESVRTLFVGLLKHMAEDAFPHGIPAISKIEAPDSSDDEEEVTNSGDNYLNTEEIPALVPAPQQSGDAVESSDDDNASDYEDAGVGGSSIVNPIE